jgi:putative Mg2+ transporter-C (MgtC) family protein
MEGVTVLAIREVTYLAVILRIFAAVLIGGLLGLERGLKNRAAGLRTYMLVCVGACIIMLTNQYIYQSFGSGDPVRMGAQVVSGIGFLGAGTIIVTRRSQIKGLTTAAGLWSSAGVGLALGIGFYEAALAGGLAVVIVMTALQGLDNRMHRKTKSVGVYFELNRETSLGDFLRIAQEKGMDIRDVIRESSSEAGNRAYIATEKLEKRKNHHDICDDVRDIPGVVYLEDL